MNPENSVNSSQISNFSSIEQDEYIARAMFRADQREQLRYAKDKGRDEGVAIGMERVFSLLRQGYSVDEAEKLLAKRMETSRVWENH